MAHAADPRVVDFEPDARFLSWFETLGERHLADLTFREVRRGVQALSTTYVENRGTRLHSALRGAGKRAAFAMFYAPLHFLLAQAVIRHLEDRTRGLSSIVDLGCGTGPCGAAWALATGGDPRVTGFEKNRWAAAEARWCWHQLGIDGRVLEADVNEARLPGRSSGVILGFTVNELDPQTRSRLKDSIFGAATRGASVLVIEPIARGLLPWWDEWAGAFGTRGGAVREWRVRAQLPGQLRLLDRAAGLDHQVLTCRSLWLSGRA